MKKYAQIILVIASLLSSNANAAGILDSGAVGVKALIMDALKDGYSEGVVEGNVAAIFQKATQSDKPLTLKVTRIKEYDLGCGRLRIEMIQDGVKADNGKLVTVNPAFELSICPSGLPPREVREENEQHRRAELQKCKVSTIKGEAEKWTGATAGTIKIVAGPAKGRVQAKYTGSCSALMMPDKQIVEYDLNEKGEKEIQLRIPAQCLQGSPAQLNQWSLIFIERGGMVLGDLVTAW